jgi:hypothetical protein
MSQDQPMAYPDYGSIIIRGARENNLKNVSLYIPKRRITVFTGVSGSGKSSLVFSTIAAESQRLINQTYPAFVQQFMPHYGSLTPICWKTFRRPSSLTSKGWAAICARP